MSTVPAFCPTNTGVSESEQRVCITKNTPDKSTCPRTGLKDGTFTNHPNNNACVINITCDNEGIFNTSTGMCIRNTEPPANSLYSKTRNVDGNYTYAPDLGGGVKSRGNPITTHNNGTNLISGWSGNSTAANGNFFYDTDGPKIIYCAKSEGVSASSYSTQNGCLYSKKCPIGYKMNNGVCKR
jgi:hypothetical protein